MMKKEKRAGKSGCIFRSRIGTLLIIAGVGLALFPFFYTVYHQYFSTTNVAQELRKILTANREDLLFLLLAGQTEADTLKAGKDGSTTTEAASTAARIVEAATEVEKGVECTEKIAPLAAGEAILYIPALEVMTGVNYGVELEDLRKIPGIYPQSGCPDTGNVSIAAHRDAWFKDLDKLEQGDEIRLYYNSKIYLYSVDEVFITDSRDWSVIEPTPEPALTLTTCHPPGLGLAPYRLIARASLAEVIEPLY